MHEHRGARIRPVPLWRNRDYMTLLGTQTLSDVGSQVSQIAFPLLMLSLTGSPAQAGLLGAVGGLPYLILSLPVGALIDRWDRKRVMILCDAGRALTLGSIPVALWLAHLTVAQLYIVALIHGILFVFFSLAGVAALPRVVPKHQLPTTMAQNQIAGYGAGLLGPSLGGYLYQLGRALPFLSDALSYVASVIGLLIVKTAFQEQRTQPPDDTLRGQILAGLLWLWQQPLVRIATFLTAGNNIVGGGLYLLLVVLAKQGMHAPATLIGVIFTIGAVGGILGSALVPPLQKRLSFGQTVIGLGLVQTLLFPLFALAPNPIALGTIFAARTVVIAVYNVVLVSYRLALIPDELQGRVNSAVRLISVGSNAVGMVLIGLLLQSFGPKATVVTCFVWLLALTLVTTASPKVRHAPPLTAGPPT